MRKLLLVSLFVVASLPACNKEHAPDAPPPRPAEPAALPTPPSAPTAAIDDDSKLDKLTTAEVARRRTEPSFYIFDNNTKERYDKGHVPGAKWVDPTKLTSVDLPADKTATLLFYCASPACSACHVAAKAALKLGYTKVYIMPDGIAGWESAKLPTEPAKV